MHKKLLVCLMIFIFVLAASGCGNEKSVSNSPADNGQKVEADKNLPQDSDASYAELAGRANPAKGMYYEMSTTSPDGTPFNGKCWLKDQNQKFESAGPDGATVITIFLGKENISYVYEPAKKQAIQQEFSKDMQEKFLDVINTEDELDDVYSSLKSSGSEVIDGHKCLIFELNSQEGLHEKIWLSSEYGIPLKMEYEQGGQTGTTEIKNIKVGNIPDSAFELPPGTEILDMSQMGMNMDMDKIQSMMGE